MIIWLFLTYQINRKHQSKYKAINIFLIKYNFHKDSYSGSDNTRMLTVCMYIYIYIYIEREREREINIYIYIYIYIGMIYVYI